MSTYLLSCFSFCHGVERVPISGVLDECSKSAILYPQELLGTVKLDLWSNKSTVNDGSIQV